MRTDHLSRARLSFAVIVGLMVFLLGSLYNEVKIKDRDIARLTASQQTIVDKLAEILTRTAAAEQAAIDAGKTPAVRVADVLEQVKGIDQTLIDQALIRARRAVTGPAGPAGATGPPGPPGPAGTSTTTAAPAATSTTTSPRGTSTTTQPAPSTTTSSTTTTRPCALGLLGACLLR